MSYISLTYHIIFGTYCRKNSINLEHEKELYKFIYNFLTAREIKVRRIGGMPDHIHILCDIPAKHALADVVKLLKIESSKFMRINQNFPCWEGWSEGYAAFTVDASLREPRRRYIMNQREHHTKVNFDDEFRQLLIDNGIMVP